MSEYKNIKIPADQVLRKLRVGILITDLEGVILQWNEECVSLFGYPAEEIIGTNVSRLYHSKYEGQFSTIREEIRQGRSVSEIWLAIHKNGSPVWIHSHSVPILCNDGKTFCVATSAHDHRTQKAMQEKLDESRERADVILNTTVDAIISIDRYGIIQSFNKAAEDMFGFLADEVTGENIKLLMPEIHARDHDQYIRNYLETGKHNIIGSSRELRAKRKSGEVFPIELAVGEAGHKEEEIFTGIIKDITERRKMEQEIIRISEDERRRIGQDLHDGLGQMLTGIGLLSQNLLNKMEANELPGTEDLRDITELIKESDKQARNLSHGLVPIEIDSSGFRHALQNLCERAGRLFNICCEFRITGDKEMRTDERSIHLFRIVQEAISNAVKHGKADRITVVLDNEPERLILRIEDNGIGFRESEKSSSHQGMGVQTMKYRAHVSGGELYLRTTEEGHTAVEYVSHNE